MNGRCHNDPMDFATEVCDSCGDQFCPSCLVYPRGSKKPPFCTNCAMALSGVRNRRPVKPLPRGEIKKRRRNLKAQLTDQVDPAESQMPGTDLINAPGLEIQAEERRQEDSSGGLMGRFRRRKTDEPAPQESSEVDLPPPVVTVVGGHDLSDQPGDMAMPAAASYDTEEEFVPSPPEHSTATAILEQLKEHEAAGDANSDNVWLPPAAGESATWTLPDLHQSPLGGGGPWESVASTPDGSPAPDGVTVDDDGAAPAPAQTIADAQPPMFVSEAELRSKGPADKDNSGNWVPPTLRGMAPQAQQNGDELPRRRRRTEEA